MVKPAFKTSQGSRNSVSEYFLDNTNFPRADKFFLSGLKKLPQVPRRRSFVFRGTPVEKH